MKKTLLSLFIGGVVFSAYSQNNHEIQAMDQTIHFDKTNSYSTTAKGTTPCSTDTLDYTIAKASGLAAVNLNNATSGQAFAQYFNAPQNITIHGVTFYAYKEDATGGISLDATVEVYLAGADSLPTGAPLVSTTVAVDTTFGGGSLAALEKTVIFSSPVVASQPYLIVIGNNSPNGMGLGGNSYTAGDGAQEWLASMNLFGTWVRSYDVTLGPNVYDADGIILPMVSYDLTVDFNVVGCLPTTGGGSIDFTSNSSPILNDRMYSLAAFIGNPDTSYVYNFGDDTTAFYGQNQTHNYAVSQAYTVTHGAGMQGWRTFCVEQKTATVDICTGIEETTNNNVSIYPNPVQSTLNITGLTKNSVITIFDVAGKVVMTTNAINEGLQTISTAGLTSGIYYVKIVDASNSSTAYKIIKE